MEVKASVQGSVGESKKEVKARLAQYLEQQPESIHKFHRWMKALELVNLIIIFGLFIVALYVSITWKNYDPMVVPFWWVTFAAAGALFGILFGLHTIILKASPPYILPGMKPFPANVIPGDRRMFVTGPQAVKWGWVLIGASFIWAVICAGVYYYMVSSNANILRTVISLAVFLFAVMMLVSIFQKLFRSHSKSM